MTIQNKTLPYIDRTNSANDTNPPDTINTVSMSSMGASLTNIDIPVDDCVMSVEREMNSIVPVPLEDFRQFYVVQNIFTSSLYDFIDPEDSKCVERAEKEFGIAERLSDRLFTEENGYAHDAVQDMTGPLFLALNRYEDAIPYNHNIVTLNEPIRNRFFHKDVQYFSGSYVSLGGLEFIACSAPMPLAFEHFWTMMLEQESNTIVMLTKLEEGEKTKAHCYIPKQFNLAKKFGGVTVTKLASDSDKSIIKTILHVQKGDQVRQISHYQYEGWPDMGVPETTDEFVRLMSLIRDEETQGKIVVHCSAGLGRAGTFIIAYKNYVNIIRHLIWKSKEKPTTKEALQGTSINTLKDLLIIRSQRGGMVQRSSQYLFIQKVLRDYFNPGL